MKGAKREAAIYAVLLASSILPFARVWTLGFTNFDDPGYVTQNPHVRDGLSAENAAWAFRSLEQSNWHPITWLSHMLDSGLYGMNPAGHHVTNLLFHVGSTLLLFSALRRMTGAVGRSMVVAALFAVHPLHVESVAWVAERKDVLSGFLWMLAMRAYVEYAKSHRALHYCLALGWLALGLGAKPMLVTFPFVLLLLDFWPLGRMGGCRGSTGGLREFSYPTVWPLLLEKIPFFLLATASSVATYQAQQAGGSVVTLRNLPLETRLPNALLSYVWYLKKAILPTDLAVFYPRPERIETWQVSASILLLAVITTVAVRLRADRPYLAVGWSWYLGTLVPVIGLVQVGEQAMADRYTYLPLIGVFLAATWAASDALTALRVRGRTLVVLAATLLLALGIVTWRQVGYWESSQSLFSRAIEVTGDNPLAYLNYGAALATEGKLDEAAGLYEGALRRNPNQADLQVNLATILVMQGKIEEAGGHFREALRIQPDQPEAHNGMCLVLSATGKLEEAAGHCRAALQLRAEYPEARYNFGKVLIGQGHPDLAIEQFRLALKLRPDYTDVHEKLASVLADASQLDEAIEHYAAAVKIRPGNAGTRYQLGVAQYQRQRREEALVQLREAARLRPDWPDALNTLAWILATGESPTRDDIAESVRLAERATALATQPNAAFLDTLAAAYAAAGRFEDALKTVDSAIRLAAQGGDPSLPAELAARQQYYRSGRRYREVRP